MYSTTITPRFGDVDGLGHINNTVLPNWFELARNPIFELFVPNLSLENWNLILAHFDFDFISQMFLGKDIEIRTYVLRIGNSSFRLYQEAWQDGKLTACGTTVLVHFDFKNQKTIKIPEPIFEKLREHLIDESGVHQSPTR